MDVVTRLPGRLGGGRGRRVSRLGKWGGGGGCQRRATRQPGTHTHRGSGEVVVGVVTRMRWRCVLRVYWVPLT